MVEIRKAAHRDLGAIVAMLADDALGLSREVVSDPVDSRYEAAFAAIDADPNQLLAVVVRADGAVIGCLQVSFIPGLSRLGLWRGQIESVRIASGERGGGLGRLMIGWAIEECRKRGCGLVQLTSDKRREEALRFYESLGFEATHEGFKMNL
ncbi:GNAT family N-acetyltransferase [Rhizobium straminoryzae]|uniref:GNAT family N-acetyltransferase n=1 Tax=Rhizobium straminoryzae TaxID=1387186 RepID=A0A549TE98_9HYPH|nr:GNAT family N-acetyltransferase [Rhizobium straminoryzae]TRL40487.1 GNAT family N-acetyltransferase [Rhizobium straminoryzae]